MDVFLPILAVILGLIGIIGSVAPGLPGPPLSWLGLLCLYFAGKISSSNTAIAYKSYLSM